MSALDFHINAGNLWGLRDAGFGPSGEGRPYWEAVKAAGYSGLQHYWPEPAALEVGLAMSGMGRVLAEADARLIAEQHKGWGFVATTLHVGTGLETDAQMDRLAAAVLDAAAATSHPLHIETHRATITQDLRRTVDLVERFPQLTFNADLSHWYTGHEMPYGDFEAKVAFITPVLERTRYMHGRIGTSSMMQAPLALAQDGPARGHFETLWRAAFAGYRRSGAGTAFIFAPELLPRSINHQGVAHHLNYALVSNAGGAWREQTDRWAEALELCELARAWFQS